MRKEPPAVPERRRNHSKVFRTSRQTTKMKSLADKGYGRKTTTPDTGKTKNSSKPSACMTSLSKMTNENFHKSGKTMEKSKATLNPNKGLLPFTQPIPTQPIPEVSTMTDNPHR